MDPVIAAAARRKGKPIILLYRRLEEPLVRLMDPNLDEKQKQYRRVEEFFSQYHALTVL